MVHRRRSLEQDLGRRDVRFDEERFALDHENVAHSDRTHGGLGRKGRGERHRPRAERNRRLTHGVEVSRVRADGAEPDLDGRKRTLVRSDVPRRRERPGVAVHVVGEARLRHTDVDGVGAEPQVQVDGAGERHE